LWVSVLLVRSRILCHRSISIYFKKWNKVVGVKPNSSCSIKVAIPGPHHEDVNSQRQLLRESSPTKKHEQELNKQSPLP
ncbi:hypothetical protein P5673_006691, partial [Acropora cervicornis]